MNSPADYGRVQRFNPGDRVAMSRAGATCHGEHSGVVLEATQDPHPLAYAHCGGNSAKYRVSGFPDPLWDWQLSPAG